MLISFRKNIVTLLLFTLAVLAIAGCSKTAKPAEVMSVENIAIDGYDPVAYVTSEKAYKADGTYQTTYKDATWFFETEENLQAFSANPEPYIPKFGGFCAYELAEGDLEESDPQFWHIHNGVVYLFNDEDAKEDWFRDIDAMLSTAQKEWELLMNPEEDSE